MSKKTSVIIVAIIVLIATFGIFFAENIDNAELQEAANETVTGPEPIFTLEKPELSLGVGIVVLGTIAWFGRGKNGENE